MGVEYDVCKVYFYFFYECIDFDVFLGYWGDNYDCYLVWFEEIK